ncbi:plexin domain-containing protein 2 [Dendroctonus ponderosae]|uniref:plexin domain-containing protein 2 n=1 Tax=Dendroctonus ponderosae TaxID=77166 RepID=UPI0020350B4F|nr:plexin domain-containing protein 2 [Dendroctonus ponderosae]
MARVGYSLCGSFCLCVCVLVLVGICQAHKADHDRYRYDTEPMHHRTEHSIFIELLENDELHKQQKRDVESRVASSLPISGNITERVIPLPLSEDVLMEPNWKWRNLGVNGTGQKRNVTTDLSETLRNMFPPKSIPHLTLNDEDEPDKTVNVSPPNLTPEDVGVGDEIDKKEFENSNITTIKTDTHVFYNSAVYLDNSEPFHGNDFWVNMENNSDVKVNDLLSSSHRRAETVQLSFEFPFYGRYIKNVTVATGGFLYTGNYIHSWLAATQYIAPLMANFDNGISNSSLVKYLDNGTAFTVEWENVQLRDKPNKEFTFQTTLYKNGDIVFVYKAVPMSIKNIDSEHHPVKVGVSDAYILDRTVFYVRRKTIYEYHRVIFNDEEIKNGTAIYLTALPTCLNYLNCSSCLISVENLNCTWCPGLQQCSTGLDRNRQFWLDKDCENKNVSSVDSCSLIEKSKPSQIEPAKHLEVDYIGTVPKEEPIGASGYMIIIFIIAVVAGCAVWTGYAYKYPHTASGQMLIRYRPSQWRWRRGEARYTAATIHM